MRVPEPSPTGGQYAPAAETALVRNAGIVGTALQVGTLLAMAGTVATRVWQDHLWFGFLLVGVTFAVWAPEIRLRRERLWWFTYVAGIFVYTLLRAIADETAIPVRADYVIWLDARLPGASPVPWLQDLRVERGFSKLVDYSAIAVHWSFFVAPHAAAAGIFFFRRALFPAYAVLVVLIMWLGLALFFLLPTVPPWLAGQQGDLPGVTRVMDSTIRESLGEETAGASTYEELYAALGEPNSVAAMPSIHMAVTFAMFLWARRYARRLAWPLLAYTGVMALALAYLGEHYVADEAAGISVALVAWALVLRSRWAPEPQAARR